MDQGRKFPFGTIIGFLLLALCLYGVVASNARDAKREQQRIDDSRRAYAEEHGMVVVGERLIEMEDLRRSSAFSSVGYDEDAEILVVIFRDSEDTYAYYEVPYYVWDEFIDSESPGEYYNKEIKGKYEFKSIE